MDEKWITGVYARVSTDHDDQKDSIEHQQQFFTDWCKNNSMEIFDYYADDGKSGTTINKRYDFQRMIDDAKKGTINCIVARSITRFARNQIDTLKIIRELQAKGVRFVFIEQGLDTHKNDGLLGLFAWLAEEESRTTSRRRKLGGRQAQKNGKFINPRPPFGYKSINQRLVIDEEEAPIVREIFTMYLSGLGTQNIAKTLNEKGYKTRRGYGFSRTKVLYMLKNEAYKGWIVGNKRTTVDPITKVRIENPPEEWIVNKKAHQPIISEEDFDKVQGIISDREFTVTKRTTRLLTGVVKCKECGSNMSYKSTTKNNGKTYSYYICNSRRNKGKSICDNDTIREDILKKVVQDELFFLKQNQKLLEDLKVETINKIKNSTTNFEQNIEDIKTTIKKLQSQRERLVEKYIEGIIPDDIYKKKEDELSCKVKEYNKQKALSYKNIKDNNRFDKIINDFEKELNGFNDIENMTNAQLKRIVKEIWVDKDKNIEVVIKIEANSCHNEQTVTTVMPSYQPPQIIEIRRNNKMVVNYDKSNDTIYLASNYSYKEWYK